MTLQARLPVVFLFVLAVMLGGAPAPAAAQAQPATQGIAAVVNDQIITLLDLEQRITVAIASSGLRDNAETRTRLRPQVLRTLIDESLQVTEARRLKLAVSSAELENAKRVIEQRNNMPRGGFAKFIADQGLPEASIIRQMTAELAWSKVVSTTLVPQVNVPDGDIDAEMARVAQSTGKYRYLLSEIFLPAETNQRDADLKGQAQKLADDIRAGANFGNVARQFSRGPSAFDAGNVGWVMEDQLSPELATVVKTLQVGAVSNPVAAGGGYYLLQLRERRQIGMADPRDTTVHLKQVALPVAANAPAAEFQRVQSRAEGISASVRGCDAMDAMIKEVATPQSGDLGRVKLADMPDRFVEALANLEVGRASAPVRSDVAIHVFMVCARDAQTVGMPTRDEIAQTLGQQKLDLLERRALTNLRRAATIDIRAR